jgi:predicted glycoside hydrolase/deacetylase ChbG (UPF0249 family)
MPDLIVNADDFGRTAGINRGIIEAHKKGIVTSTTVMVNYADAMPGIETALKDAPFLGLGLHLNLTSGQPVLAASEVPSLVVEDGRFHGAPGLPPFASMWDAGEIEAELRAQMARFVALAGHAPDHLDSHHHSVYVHPVSFRVMLDLATEYKIPIRRPGFGETPAETARSHWLLSPLPEDEALARAEAVHALLAQYAHVRYPRFLGSFYDEKAILGELLAILTTLPDDEISELMCHPGYAEGLDSIYNVQREQEIKWLTHPSAHEVVVAENIRLKSYAALYG